MLIFVSILLVIVLGVLCVAIYAPTIRVQQLSADSVVCVCVCTGSPCGAASNRFASTLLPTAHSRCVLPTSFCAQVAACGHLTTGCVVAVTGRARRHRRWLPHRHWCWRRRCCACYWLGRRVGACVVLGTVFRATTGAGLGEVRGVCASALQYMCSWLMAVTAVTSGVCCCRFPCLSTSGL